MKIGIVGSRRRDEQDDFLAVAKALQSLLELKLQPNEEVILVSGGCPKGGDRFAEDLAKQLGYEMVIHPADWKRYGRGAGFVRNTDIAAGSDYLIACVAPDRKGGTEDTVRKFCKKLGLTEEEAIVTGWLVLVS